MNNPVRPLPYRQVHLDFHTSPMIPGVAADFDPERFAATMAAARVASVTCFARCHHGHLYYATKAHPERVHPALVRPNLLKEMVDACHRRGIRVPIYTTVQWDRYSWDHHPEWRLMTHTGGTIGFNPLSAGFYGGLDIGKAAYREFLKRHTSDIFEVIGDVDGMFYDIVWPHWAEDCSLESMEAMGRLGLDPRVAADRVRFSRHQVASFVAEITGHVHRLDPKASVYYNNGGLGANNRDFLGHFTHLEFDALPGENPDGYHHLPVRGRFERNLHRCVGQTGKFHTSWGDFGSYKNRAALEFECFHLLALNLRCLIGDQLHPSGREDQAAYDLIGAVFRQVEAVEPWCEDAVPLVDLAVLSGDTDETRAMVRMLAESAMQFDVVDDASDFSRYAVLVLTDSARISPELAQRLRGFLAGGGRILASFEAGFDPATKRFVLDEWGVRPLGDGPVLSDGQPARGQIIAGGYDNADYLRPRPAIAGGLPLVDHQMYANAREVAVSAGGEILADVIAPVFYRTFEHFCSHKMSPTSGRIASPGAVHTGNVVYFAHPICRIWSELSPRWVKVMVMEALRRLLPRPLLRHDGPSTVIATVNRQEPMRRSVVHLLHYIPEHRAKRLEIIEEVIPLHDLAVTLRADHPVRQVTLEPQGTVLPHTATEDGIRVVVPRLAGHQLVVFA